MEENPLLMPDSSSLPPFSRIRPEHAEPAVRAIIEDNRRALGVLLDSGAASWEGLVKPLEAMEDRLDRAFAPVSHLNAVINGEGWRAAYNACLPLLSDYAADLGQNEALFRAVQALAESEEYRHLQPAERKVIDNALRDFRLAGVALPGEAKGRYKEILQRLSSLSARFQDNLLDATEAWKKPIAEREALAGLPATALAQMAQNAERAGQPGYLVGLDTPSYLAVMTYADDRALRREVYEAYNTRASDQGPHAGRFDNTEVMEEILALRHEGATLLAFSDYAEQSLATKMAADVATVERFLLDLAARARPVAERELAELTAFARERDGIDRLEPWDLAYYAEHLRQRRYELSQEALRAYFPAPRVIDGMFQVVGRLYGVTLQAVDCPQVWHPQVELYEVRDAAGELRGRLYMDLYARKGKRGGAWMADYAGRRRSAEGLQIPVAFLTCNFTPPLGEKPAELTHEEVLTLFHEFGHTLHHLLTRVDHLAVSGINGVAWDAVELPSQFMENFCWEREVLDLISGHVETGEPLPEPVRQRMLAARNFQAGMQMLRQIEFSLFDLRLHHRYQPGIDGFIQKTLDAVRAEVAVMTPPSWNRFAHGFAHIFAGGYAAGYYSYKWAEVLSADAFSAFEENGVLDRRTGERFLHTVLEQGGSRDAAELFEAFRGRPPSIEPLLRQHGLAA